MMFYPKSWSPFFLSHNLLKIFSSGGIVLPTPINISNLWNYGSFLGILLGWQILSGLFLTSHYIGDIALAFECVDSIMRNVSGGWILRTMHLNGASFFFLALYIHLGRGLYYFSYFNKSETWNMGVVIFIVSMLVAFMGYVLPWGQMSFWGATVITSLISTIPYIGESVVLWLWGGFSVGGSTLSRFFMLHFALPFIIVGLVILHLFFLHEGGSSNPLSISSSTNVIFFAPFFWWKDLLFIFNMLSTMFIFILWAPFYLGDPENFILANPMVTPTHIVPEWYFLFAYAILRSTPNKLLGVVLFALSILILFTPPLVGGGSGLPRSLNPFGQFGFFSFTGVMVILTWLGGQVVEEPFMMLGQMFSVFYFCGFLSVLWRGEKKF